MTCHKFYLLPIAWLCINLLVGCNAKQASNDDDSSDVAVAGKGDSADPEDGNKIPTEDVAAADSANEDGTANNNPDSGSDEIQPTNRPIDISFEDVNLGMKEDMVFRDWLVSDRLNELTDKNVRIKGYMLPHERRTGIKRFVLLKNLECKFGPGGQADHLMDVKLQDKLTTRYHTKVVEVEGALRLRPFNGPDGNTWSIYELQATKVNLRRR